MRKIAPVVIAGLLTSAAFADFTLKFPAVDSTVKWTSATLLGKDTAGLPNGISLYSTSAGVGTKVTATTSSVDTSLTLTYTLVPAEAAAKDGSIKYSGTIGALLPLETMWDGHDISAADTLIFDIKSSTNTATGATQAMVNLIIGSPLTEKWGNVDAGLQSMSVTYFATPPALGKVVSGVYAPTTSWTTVKILTSKLVPAPWYVTGAGTTDNIAIASAWRGAEDSGIDIGTLVRNFQIQPVFSWKDSVHVNNPSGSISIKNFRVKGADLQTFHQGSCASITKSFQWDDFAGLVTTDLKRNTTGGYWFAYTDTNSLKDTGAAVGATTIKPTNPGDTSWGVTSNLALLSATLEKNVKTKYHPYAGWADLGTAFTKGSDPVVAPNLKAIMFDLHITDLPSTFGTWDKAKVPTIIFKAGLNGVGDDSAFQLAIPVSKGDGSSLCIDLDSLKQASYIKTGLTWAKAAAKGIKQFSWEAKIEDQTSSAIHTSGPNTFGLGNVYLYGYTSDEFAALLPVGVKARHGLSGFRAAYNGNLVVSYKVEATSAQIEVLRLDGSKVASFQAAPVANKLNLPVSLQKGTYLVAVHGAGKTQVASIAVAR